MRFKRTNMATVILAITMLGLVFTGCAADIEQLTPETTIVEVENKTPETIQDNKQQIVQEKEPETAVEIDAHFSQYYNTQYTKIDEKSALKLIRLAMEDVKQLFYDLDSPNMKYDKNLKIIDGADNFYPDWMDEYFFLGRAMAESSLRIDVITDATTKTAENDPRGIMQICPEEIKETLSESYFKPVFGADIDFSEMQVFPSAEDVKNVNISREAEQRVLQTIYNNMFLSICYSVYNAKCLNPVSHTDYYAKYKDYDSARKLGVIVEYHEGHGFVVDGLQKGQLRELSYAKVDKNGNHYLKTYIENIENYQKQFAEKYNNVNLNQMQ